MPSSLPLERDRDRPFLGDRSAGAGLEAEHGLEREPTLVVFELPERRRNGLDGDSGCLGARHRQGSSSEQLRMSVRQRAGELPGSAELDLELHAPFTMIDLRL